ncbi:MAG: hypothetical protein IMZ59_02120 [Actinobacteria bacterium]|nr:hypothetical protein [Actinomycetota bacterium]
MMNLRMTDKDGITHTCLIEAQTYAKYKKVTEKIFLKHVLKEFMELDPIRAYTWIVTVTEDNIERTKPWCEKYGIHILPVRTEIREQIWKMVEDTNK